MNRGYEVNKLKFYVDIIECRLLALFTKQKNIAINYVWDKVSRRFIDWTTKILRVDEALMVNQWEKDELNAKIIRVSVDLIIYAVRRGTVIAATYWL